MDYAVGQRFCIVVMLESHSANLSRTTAVYNDIPLW